MKKKSLIPLLLAPALLLPGAASAAETILTPTQLQTVPHVIGNYSIWQGDSTIAFDVTQGTGPSNIWTVPRFGSTGTQVTNGTVGAHDPLWAPLQPNPGIPPDPNMPPTQTNELGLLAYVQDLTTEVSAGTVIATTNELIVSGFGSQSGTKLVGSFSWALDASSLVFSGEENSVSVTGELYTTVFGGPGPVAIITTCPLSTGAPGSPVAGVQSKSCGNPQWSPTDNVIAYNAPGMYLVNPDGSDNHEIVSDPVTVGGQSEDVGGATPIWSPNSGSMLAFYCILITASSGSDVCVSTSDGVNVTNITNAALGLDWFGQSWSIDENFIASVGLPHNSPPGTLGDVYVFPVAGGAPVQVTNTGNVLVDSVQFSPLTDEIFYLCQHGSNVDLCVAPQSGLSGGSPPSCDITNCSPGCCLNNLCAPGVARDACGTGAAACVACPGNEVCGAGQTCVAPPACNASTCNGCCDAAGTCHPGTQSDSCGSAGAACVACPGSEVCSGTSVHACKSNTCSAATCAGCCNAQGQCDTGVTATSCGSNGFACVKCPGSEVCNDGVCEAPAACNISTCPAGCCDTSGHCQAGTSPTSCGSAGSACVSCNGGVCDNNSRTCGSPTACNNQSCQGCCGPTGCLAGDTNAACGNEGFTCEACTGSSSCDFSSGLCE